MDNSSVIIPLDWAILIALHATEIRILLNLFLETRYFHKTRKNMLKNRN